MKKIIFLLIILSFNAHAANFIDTLAGECGEILAHIEYYDYPTNYDNIKPRNSQFWALKKCLDVYKENGGDIEDLNKRFELAHTYLEKMETHCYMIKKDENKSCTAKPHEYASLIAAGQDYIKDAMKELDQRIERNKY